MIKKKLIYICLIVSFFFNIYLILNKPKSISSNLSKSETIIVLKKLITLSDSKISKNYCEIYRDNRDNRIVDNPTVLDFFSDSLMTFFDSNSYTFLECNDNKCFLHIGIKKYFESYSRILKFKYVKENNYIDISSFECIDIP